MTDLDRNGETFPDEHSNHMSLYISSIHRIGSDLKEL